MFDFFKRKQQPQPAEQNPIPLPEIPSEKMNPVALHEMLKNRTAIWGWYKVTDMRNNELNFSALLNMTLGFDGFAVFRREGDYLVKYRVDSVGEEHAIYMKLSEICRLTPSNVMELYNIEFADAYKLFYDDDSNYSAGCQCYVHDVNEEMIENALSTRRVFHIGEEHFFKKSDYPDGLPTAEEE